MEIVIILSIFILGLLFGIIGYLVYIVFGFVVKEFCDLFEEYED